MQIQRLREVFKHNDDDFYKLLSSRVVVNNFTDKKLKDAVSNAIDTFPYKELNVADIINFDKKLKLYNYEEMLRQNLGTKPFRIVRRTENGNLWAKISEIEQLGLKL